MATRERTVLGAPGVYPVAGEPLRAITGVRMDVAGFVGVAPRGPSRLPAHAAWWAEPPCGPAAPTAGLRSVPVPVESWSEYRRLFGGFEGPGLLPYAVAAFFENGGRRAYVVRIVHDYGEGAPENDAGVATGAVPGVTPRAGGTFTLRARDEGSWGNRLRAILAFEARPLAVDDAGTSELTLPPDAPVGVGTLLRLWLAGGTTVLRFVSDTRLDWAPDRPRRIFKVTLETAAPSVPERVEIVEAELAVSEVAGDGMSRAETHKRLGLSPFHERWVAAVLHRESALLRPDEAWLGDDLLVDDPTLRAPADPGGSQFTGGLDRYAVIDPEDFFDGNWVPQDDQPRCGVHALLSAEDVSIVVVPDLYSPAPLAEREKEEVLPSAGPTFEVCLPSPPAPADESPGDGSDEDLDGLRLDPAFPDERAEVVALQQRLVDLAELVASWIVLLDAPPRLNQRELIAWRAGFGTAWAAAYHPWVRVARPDDARTPLVTVNPAAFAAGIVARQEIAFGVPHGPANALLVGGVSLTDSLSPARHDELHQASINALLVERDGIRLTAARTLSRDPQWRQLSVRRLVTMVRRTLLRQMQWAVFEPNDARLRDEIQRLLQGYLRQLFRANAFRGRSPSESYFVRCDESLNTPQVVDEGRLVCHVGIAPAEPLEFILLRLSRDGDGTLLMEE